MTQADFTSIRLEIQGSVATIILNRPDSLNSFTTRMHEELRDALDRIESDGTVRALILTGAGRGFCAGQDLGDRAVKPGGAAVDLGESVEKNYNPLVLRLRRMALPVICAVNGVAAGAGANIALACDIVIAARSASFLQPFCNIGLVPDSGGTYILPRALGLPRAMGLALLGEKLGAERAAEWGLIWEAVDDDRLMDRARELAARLAAGPTRGYAAIKQALHASLDNALEDQLDLERNLQRDLGFSADYQEGVAAFLAKRKPAFTGK